MTQITPIPTVDLADQYLDDLRYCETQFRNYGGHKAFAGTVRTVKCRRDNGLIKQLLNSPGEGCVLVIDGGGEFYSALTGDMIATAAVKNGWSGLVINGAIRDSAEIGTLELGVKALGTSPRKSTKDRAGEVDVPVSFGGVTFNPGDVLHADADGVVLLP